MNLGGFVQQLPPIVPILCLAFVLLMIGGGVILILSGNKDQSKANAQKKGSAATAAPPAAEPSSQPAAASPQTSPPPRPTGIFRTKLSTGESVEVVEVMVVLRDVANGTLIAQIGDQSYACPPDTADADFTRRYAIAVRDLAATAADPAKAARPAPPRAAPSVSAPDTAAAPDLELAPSLDDLLAPPAPTSKPTAGSVPGDLPKFSSPEASEPPRLGRRPASSAPIPEINIAASIESYLQYRLLIDGRFVDRRVHVLPAPDGVQITVDGEIYEAVDDVKDPIVKEFLRATIAEWQNRQ